MKSWAHWYQILVAFWALFAVPGAVVSYLFSGGDFELPHGLAGWALWLPLVLFLMAPVLLWPWRKLEGGRAL
jgi:hypothetical protein